MARSTSVIGRLRTIYARRLRPTTPIALSTTSPVVTLNKNNRHFARPHRHEDVPLERNATLGRVDIEPPSAAYAVSIKRNRLQIVGPYAKRYAFS